MQSYYHGPRSSPAGWSPYPRRPAAAPRLYPCRVGWYSSLIQQKLRTSGGAIQPRERITSLCVTNASNKTQEIKLTLFRVGITADALATDPRCISDADIATTYFCAKAPLDITMPIPEGCSELITVGNVRCDVTNANLTSEGEHVRRYKLTPGAEEVRITHPQQPYAFLNEVIFK